VTGCPPAVVFGHVIEGMPVVKRIEVCGSRSGKPTKRVQITDCGEVRCTPLSMACA
jgi:hypothetical protein